MSNIKRMMKKMMTDQKLDPSLISEFVAQFVALALVAGTITRLFRSLNAARFFSRNSSAVVPTWSSTDCDNAIFLNVA